MGPGQHPQYTRAWYARDAVGGSQHDPHPNCLNMVAERQCWLLSSKGVQPACATVSGPVMHAMHCKAYENFPVHQCRNVDDCRMHTYSDRAERASVVSIRTVVIVILDSRRRTLTEIRYVKTLTIVVLVRLFARRQDASDNPMRAIHVEKLVFNVFVGGSGDKWSFISPHL